MKNHAENVLQKLVPESFSILQYKLKQAVASKKFF